MLKKKSAAPIWLSSLRENVDPRFSEFTAVALGLVSKLKVGVLVTRTKSSVSVMLKRAGLQVGSPVGASFFVFFFTKFSGQELSFKFIAGYLATLKAGFNAKLRAATLQSLIYAGGIS